jgi:hypothetical protein
MGDMPCQIMMHGVEVVQKQKKKATGASEPDFALGKVSSTISMSCYGKRISANSQQL